MGVARRDEAASWGDPSEGEARDSDAACGNQILAWGRAQVGLCDEEGRVWAEDGGEACASWEDGERAEEWWVELGEERGRERCWVGHLRVWLVYTSWEDDTAYHSYGLVAVVVHALEAGRIQVPSTEDRWGLRPGDGCGGACAWVQEMVRSRPSFWLTG